MKDYQKPEVELVNLTAMEAITEDILDGSITVTEADPNLPWED